MLPSGTPASALRLDQIPAARTPNLVSVLPFHSLQRAETLLIRHKREHLPVLADPATAVGVVSLQSIAVARSSLRTPTLSCATRPAEVLSIDVELWMARPLIVRDGFVLVRDLTGVISGIVTLADANDAIQKLTGPHLLLGEIESRLRWLLNRACTTADELRAATGRPNVNTTADLTLGDLERAFREPSCWTRLAWSLDQDIFTTELRMVRQIRNKFAHYRFAGPEPLSREENQQLVEFLDWLRQLVPDC